MERYAWKGYVKEGMLEEYVRRHDEIWAEMSEMLTEAGVTNYSIWNVGNELFGYYECESVEDALAFQANSPVTARWDEYMSDILTMEEYPPGEHGLRQVFLHE